MFKTSGLNNTSPPAFTGCGNPLALNAQHFTSDARLQHTACSKHTKLRQRCALVARTAYQTPAPWSALRAQHKLPYGGSLCRAGAATATCPSAHPAPHTLCPRDVPLTNALAITDGGSDGGRACVHPHPTGSTRAAKSGCDHADQRLVRSSRPYRAPSRSALRWLGLQGILPRYVNYRSIQTAHQTDRPHPRGGPASTGLLSRQNVVVRKQSHVGDMTIVTTIPLGPAYKHEPYAIRAVIRSGPRHT